MGTAPEVSDASLIMAEGNTKVLAKRRLTEVRSSAPPENLFREEAIRRRLEIGRPRPVDLTPLPWRIITWLLVAVTAGAIAFAAIGTFPRKETVSGIIRPRTGEVMIDMRRDGRVAQLFVREGQTVQAGEPLMAIDSDTSMLDGRSLWATQYDIVSDQLATAQSRRAARSGDLAAQIAVLQVEATRQAGRIEAIAERRKITEQRRALALPYLEKLEGLLERGYTTQREVLRQRDAIYALDLDIRRLDEDAADARSALASARADQAALIARANVDAVNARQEEISLEDRAVSSASAKGELVRAPQAGRVTNLAVSRGKWLRSGSPVMALLPAGEEYVGQLQIPSSAIGFVSAGDRVRLMYDSFPFQKFGFAYGTIDLITAMPAADPAKPDQRLYLARVKLDKQSVLAFGDEQGIKPGMTFRADIILENRTILEWIFEPMLAATGRFQGQ